MASANKIPQLIDALDDIPAGLASTSDDFLRRTMPQFYAAVKDAAPEGRDEPEFVLGNRKYSFGRPSRRQGFKPIAEGWVDLEYSRSNTGDRVISSAQIKSRSEHIRWVIEGTDNHPEPKYKPGPMVFFWFRRNQGWGAWHINHPGTDGNNFVENLLANRWRNLLGLEFRRVDFLKSIRDVFNA